MSDLSSLLAQESARFRRSEFNTGINPKDRSLAAEYAERTLRMTAGASRRDAGTFLHEGVECAVLKRRGGVVTIEIAEGIKKEVQE